MTNTNADGTPKLLIDVPIEELKRLDSIIDAWESCDDGGSEYTMECHEDTGRILALARETILTRMDRCVLCGRPRENRSIINGADGSFVHSACAQ
jgi:hypothetical protein